MTYQNPSGNPQYDITQNAPRNPKRLVFQTKRKQSYCLFLQSAKPIFKTIYVPHLDTTQTSLVPFFFCREGSVMEAEDVKKAPINLDLQNLNILTNLNLTAQ